MVWFLTAGRWPCLAVLALGTLLFGWQASRVGIEADNRSLTVRRPEEASRDRRFEALFGRDDDLLLAVAHPALVTADGLRYLDDLVTTVAALPGVARAYALTNVQTAKAGAGGAEMVPLVARPIGREAAVALGATLDGHPEFTGLLVSADRRTAGVLIELTADGAASGGVIDALRALMRARAERDVGLHLTGIAVQKHDVSAYIARDQRVLVPLAVATLGCVLWVFFRRPLGVLLPLAVTGITVVWTLGIYRLFGLELNAITALLPPVLMVLSLAVSVHLIEAWIESAEPDPVARVRAALRRVWFPVLLCSLTTAFGFGSLATSEMPAVRSFGLFAALGVAVAFLAGTSLVPIVLARARPPERRGAAPVRGGVAVVLEWFADLAIERPGRVLLAFVLLTACAAAGLPRVRNNTDLVRFFRPSAPLFRDTMFVDRHLTGPTTLDFVVSRRDGGPLTRADDLRRLAAFEASAAARPHVSGVTSIVPVLRSLEAAENGGAPRLPADDEAAAYLFDLLGAADDPGLLRKLVSPDARSVRMNVRVHAIGTSVAAPLADTLLADGRRLLGEGYEVDVTGAFHRVAEDSNSLVASQMNTFGLAFVLVFAAIGLLFRSVTLVLIVVVANLMPIVWTGGIMGFAGIDLSTGTAMIASAVIGLVVDDTIHFLSCYRRLAKTVDPVTAVHRATREAGPALLVNNLVLVLGFWVGCFSSFKPTILFSLLSGLTMLTAMLCDLLVTPACLVLLARRTAVAVLVLAVGLGASGAAANVVVPPSLAPALDDAGERRWARTDVPDPARKVGEVRLVTRGEANVVETLLSTTLLPRAVREIRAKETRNWPAGAAGHDDAMRYVEALDGASAELGRRLAGRAPGEDRRRNLLIEFVLTPAGAWVVLSRFVPGTDERGEMRVTEREPLAVLAPARDYVRGNMRLIAEDSFDAHGPALERLLAPLRLTIDDP
jgi:predicted RND superfamily exporter protein